MYKTIIVEGMDGSGKSTFIEKVIARTSLQAYHAGGPPKTRDEALERIRETMFIAQEADTIFDRHVTISEQVYGYILRDNSFLTFDYSLRTLGDMEALILYCRPPNHILTNQKWNLIEKDHDTKNHVLSVGERYFDLSHAYDRLMFELEAASLLVVQFNPFNDRVAEHMVKSIINERKVRHLRINDSEVSC